MITCTITIRSTVNYICGSICKHHELLSYFQIISFKFVRELKREDDSTNIEISQCFLVRIRNLNNVNFSRADTNTNRIIISLHRRCESCYLQKNCESFWYNYSFCMLAIVLLLYVFSSALINANLKWIPLQEMTLL